jgi:hypothetical protein
LLLNKNEKIYIGDYVLACGDIEQVFWLRVGMIRTKNYQIFNRSKVKRAFSNNSFIISETIPLIPESQYKQWKLGNTSIVNFDKHVELLKIDNTPPDTDIVGVIYYNFIFKAKDLGYTVINLDENQYDDNGYLVNVLKTNSYLVYIIDLSKTLFKK